MEDDWGSTSRPSGAAAERQARVEDETASEAAAPTVTAVEREVGSATPDDWASRSRPVSRSRSPRQRYMSSSESSPEASPEPRWHRVAYVEDDYNYVSPARSSISVERQRWEPPSRGPSPITIHTRRRDIGSSPKVRFREYSPRRRSREYDPRGRSRSPSDGSTYDIDLDGDEPRDPDEPLPQEWTQPRTVLEDNTVTELIVAQSVEHRVSKSGLERIVLMSPPRPPPSSSLATGQEREKSRVQLRWLHVQPNTPEADDAEPGFQTLEVSYEDILILGDWASDTAGNVDAVANSQDTKRFVLNCPFISTRARAATLLFLRSYARKNIRATGEISSLGEKLESETRLDEFVYLETAPMLFLGTLGVDRSYAKTLLKVVRGYEVGDERELSQVARKMGVGGGRDVLHAATCWCLSLGPGIVITLCCLPSADLRRDLIEIDDRAGRGFYTVQVKLQDIELCHSIVIDPDCSYVDFLQHAVAMATSGTRGRDAAKYDVLYGSQTSVDAGKLEQLELLTPSKWLRLLGSDGLENTTFHLRAKFRARSRSRRPYHHERRPPPPVRRTTRYEELPAPTRYGYSEDTGRGQTHDDKALVVHRRDQKAINRAGSEERPEPLFVRDPHEHRSGLDTDQNWRTASDDVVRRRSEAWRKSPPIPILPDLARKRYVDVRGRSTSRERNWHVEVRRHSTDLESDRHVEARRRSPSEHNFPLIDRERAIIRTRRSPSAGSDIRRHNDRSRWLRRQGREYDSDSNETPTAEQETPPLDDSGVVTVAPFFAWRVKSMTDVHTVGGFQNNNSTSPMTDIAIHNLFRILGKVNDSLLSSESGIKEVYSQAYKCTEENLLKRHPNVTRETVPSSNEFTTVQRDGIGQGKEADQENNRGSADNGSTQPPATSPLGRKRADSASHEQETVWQEKTEPSNIGDEQATATPQAAAQGATGGPTSAMIINPADAFGKQLVEVSQAIMHRFLPKDEHSMYHVVCERFWGSVDEAIRQVRWSTEPSGALWAVRDFDTMSGAAGGSGGMAAKKPYTGCTACSTTTRYRSASAALQHLHTVHFECPLGEPASVKAKDRPHDDPCYAYIKSLTDTHSNEPEIETIAKELIDHLSDFSGSLNKIQWLVATNSQNNAQRRRSKTKPAIPPQLPRSLIYAFDELVSYYILQAKRLSLQNRGIALSESSNAAEQDSAHAALHRSRRLALRCRDTRARLQSFLQQARRDVILSGSGHSGRTRVRDDDGAHTAALGVQAFDTTSFMRALLRSVLDTSLSAPLPLKKPAGTGGARVGLGRLEVGKKVPAWDVIRMYSEYSKHLHVEAARRPRRRLFLDLHALEDELEALGELLEDTLHWIGWVHDQFPEPDKSLDVKPGKRGAWNRRYREVRTMEVERSEMLGRQDALKAKLAKIQSLQKSARALRERVRQLIEVMDEDHGKAIRVFTIVTVLFLPLTFVSGFLGMNTVDIRDTTATQSLYWAIAVPVTVIVLGLAVAYGYQGDEITDWIRDRINLWKASRFSRSAAEVGAQRRLETPKTIDGRRVTWAETDAGGKGVWRTVRDSVRRPKRRSDMDVMRRSTFQSDILP